MTQFLVLALTGAMGAFGGHAGETRRGTLDVPGRSAILGLMAACLGIRRHEVDRLSALSKWRVAVGVLRESSVVRDFHTIQTVHADITAPRSRAQALRRGKRVGKVSTVLTERDYLTEPAFSVALWGGSDIEALQHAVRHPTFVPYLGRKSCPLSAPMAPKVVDASGPVAALNDAHLPPWLAGARLIRVHSDAHPEIVADRIEERSDVPLYGRDRGFLRRDVHVQDLSGDEV